ncbi:MAG: GSCFA domain-containing protein [Rhodospirillaceae bacterium]|jgi:hypothetical protein|nr:GSCFA domain-containing protein [Rhodospirillaceae bacterium]
MKQEKKNQNPHMAGSLAPSVKGSGPASWGERSWHADNVTTYPDNIADWTDMSRLIREFVLPGHIPPSPFLTENDTIITLGSCFARELRFFLSRYGLSSANFWIPSGLNNTFALADFVSWCVTGKETDRGYRYDRTDSGQIVEWKPDDEQRVYAQHLSDAGAFAFTLGLAEVWEDTQTGQVFWRGVPESIFDDQRHRFRLSTVEENVSNIREMIKLIRTVNHIAPIVFTLSPVPLKATYRPQSCITSDCVSKSTLRVALDQAINDGAEHVYYYPSFEIVKWLGCSLSFMAFSMEDDNTRHVSRWYVINIIKEFVSAFFEPAAVAKFAAGLKADGIPDDTSQPFRYAAGQTLN